MADDTKGWFFVATRTTRADGTTTNQIRGGGKPAMVLAVGVVLLLAYGAWVWAAHPSVWLATGGSAVILITFIVMFVYMTERERGPRTAEQTNDN